MRGGVRTNRPFPFPVRALRGHEWCPYLDVGSQVGKQTRDGARGLKRVLGQCSHSCLYVWRWLPLGSVKCIVKADDGPASWSHVCVQVAGKTQGGKARGAAQGLAQNERPAHGRTCG